MKLWQALVVLGRDWGEVESGLFKDAFYSLETLEEWAATLPIFVSAPGPS